MSVAKEFKENNFLILDCDERGAIIGVRPGQADEGIIISLQAAARIYGEEKNAPKSKTHGGIIAMATTAMTAALSMGVPAQAIAQKDDGDTDPTDFWSFSAGIVRAGKQPLYTPKGFFWEANTPGLGKPGSLLRRHTGLRAGYMLINEGEIGFNFTAAYPNPRGGLTTTSVSARQTYTQAYGDLKILQGFGTKESDLYAQAYIFGGAGFTPGANVNYLESKSNFRYGIGAIGFYGVRVGGKGGIGLQVTAELMDEPRNMGIIPNILDVTGAQRPNPLYESGLKPNFKAALMLTID